MGRATMRVPALASVLFACLALGAAGLARPVVAADDAQPSPAVYHLPKLTALTAGQLHDCGLGEDGSVWCWGSNVDGTLGVGSDEHIDGPVQVDIPDRATAISAGANGTCALTAAGAVWCWGDNEYGQMGGGPGADQYRPLQVPGLDHGVATLAAQWIWHVCAIMDDGSARCWGYNDFGQLGNGTRGASTTPVTVTVTSERLVAITAGLMHTCALTASGGVLCWGDGLDGQLGNGQADVSETAVVPVGLDRGVTAIGAGATESCALLDDGSIRCWGDNTVGQLGNGTTTSSSVPVDVDGLTGPADTIGVSSTGINQHACALRDNGAAACWGFNGQAELGDGTTTNRLVATPVLASPIALLAVGGNHGTAVLQSGSLVTWGDGDPTVRAPFATSLSTGYRPTGPLVPTITTEIPTPADVSTDPPVVGANLLLAAIAMIAFTIAIELLNRTLADAEPLLDRRIGLLVRFDRARSRVDAVMARRVGHGRVSDALRVVGIAAFYGVVFALLDPTWDPLSVTGLWLVLSFALACGLVGVSDDLASWATARRWGVAGEMSVRPGSLVAAMTSTVATRALVLVPGVMIGTPEALEVDESELDRPRRGRLAAIGLGAVGIVGGTAWLVTLATGPLAAAAPAVAVLVSGLEAFLLLVFAVAVQNAFVQLLAFRNSAGRALFHVNKLAWAAALLGVTFVFWHTLVNPQGDLAAALGSTNVQAFLATVGVVLAIAAGAWLITFVGRRRARRGVAAPAPAAEAALAPEPRTEPPPVATSVVEPSPIAAPGPGQPPAPVTATSAPPPYEWKVVAMTESKPITFAPGSPPGAAGTVAVLEPPAAPAGGDGGRVPCPRCAEPIQPAAHVCRYCGLELASMGLGVAIPDGAVSAPPAATVGAAPAVTDRSPAAVGTCYPLQVPGRNRLAGPARLTVSPAGLELDAGWVDLVADRLTTIVTAIVLTALTIAALPILVAALDGRFHPERVRWLPELLVLIPFVAVVGLGLLRRWRDRRRLPIQTSCPVLAAEAKAGIDADSAVIVAILGGLLGGVAALFRANPAIQLAAGLGGLAIALGVYLAMAGRTMVILRAPLDPERSSSVVVRLRARSRDVAAEVVATVRAAQAAARSREETVR